ncbi:hypothetical protein GQ42DRAFT_165416 [Ramicandelaber brevisporus]|nr:hypothetical protein GQ42DRAFT_165416 [Ramicandelaber brevisporus]
MQGWRHYWTALLATLLLLAATATAYKTTDDVKGRAGPGTDFNILKVFPNNTDVSVLCQVEGQNIFGDSIWSLVEKNPTVYVSDYYINTGKSGFLDGVPNCKEYLSTRPDSDGLSTGAIVGIAVGGGAGVVIAAFLVYWFLVRKRDSSGGKGKEVEDGAIVYQPVILVDQSQQQQTQQQMGTSTLDGIYASNYVTNAYTTAPAMMTDQTNFYSGYGSVLPVTNATTVATADVYQNPYASLAYQSPSADQSLPSYDTVTTTTNAGQYPYYTASAEPKYVPQAQIPPKS